MLIDVLKLLLEHPMLTISALLVMGAGLLAAFVHAVYFVCKVLCFVVGEVSEDFSHAVKGLRQVMQETGAAFTHVGEAFVMPVPKTRDIQPAHAPTAHHVCRICDRRQYDRRRSTR